MRGRLLALASLTVLAVIVLAGSVTAEEPRQTDWSPQEVQGAPAGAGFLAGGHLALGVTDSGTLATPEETCEASNADLYLFQLRSGCVDVVDATDRNGVNALATADRVPRVFIAPVPEDDLSSSGPDLIAYDVQESSLSHAFERSLRGFVTLIDTNPEADRAVTVAQDGEDPDTATYRLNAYLQNGNRERSYELEDTTLALDLSRDARYAAVGGETVQDANVAGWMAVYDLTQGKRANPVSQHVIPGGPGATVNSTAVTSQGVAYAGSLDGTVTRLSLDGDTTSLDAGNGTATVTTNRDGSLVAAGAGDEVSRLVLDDGDQLTTSWTNRTQTPVEDVLVRTPYVFSIGDEKEAFDRDGDPLWTVPAGLVTAANRTGLALASATTGGTGTGPAGQPTSMVQAHDVFRNASLEQTDDVPTISPGGSGFVNMTIQNSGAAVLHGSLEDRRSPLEVRFAPETFTLLPGENLTVQATVDVPRSQRAGLVDVPIEVATKPRVDASADLTVDVGRTTQLDLRLEPGTLDEQSVVQGQNLTVHLLLTNRGNTDTTATLSTHQSPTQGDRWDLSLDPRGQVTVPDGSTTSVTLDLTVPEDAEDGTVNQIVVRASTETATTATSIAFTVNPFEAVDIDPDRVTKTMAPGTTTPYTFTITNLGSVPTNVTVGASEVTDDGTLVGPGTWGLALDRSIHPLDAGEEGEVTIELTAPANATDAEDRTIRVQVLAQTEGGQRATALAFGVADPSLADDEDDDGAPDDQDETPLPGLLAVAGIAAAAVLHRRTYHGNL